MVFFSTYSRPYLTLRCENSQWLFAINVRNATLLFGYIVLFGKCIQRGANDLR